MSVLTNEFETNNRHAAMNMADKWSKGSDVRVRIFVAHPSVRPRYIVKKYLPLSYFQSNGQ